MSNGWPSLETRLEKSLYAALLRQYRHDHGLSADNDEAVEKQTVAALEEAQAAGQTSPGINPPYNALLREAMEALEIGRTYVREYGQAQHCAADHMKIDATLSRIREHLGEDQ